MTSPATNTRANDTVRALQWRDDGLRVLDQRQLPGTIAYDTYATADGVAEAIATMRVRGAPAIGIAAAFGVALAARQRYRDNPDQWRASIETDMTTLARSRPTAVNLFWALDKMRGEFGKTSGDPFPALLEAALAIHDEDVAANRAMGEFGADLLGGATGVLTHCNTGSLATGGYGTALGVIRSACQRNPRAVFATETRPWLQGARLTVWELDQDRIPATLIADPAAAYLMKSGQVQWVVVGADRIAANGDTANKIGTYALAVAARHHGVRFMIAAPTSTIDWRTETGEGIEIEEREQRELLYDHFQREDSVIKAWNPVFDVTPAGLIDAIVTERGVVRYPNREAMRALLA
jgi:methylthioribose-1-phosphate isomerase